LSEGVAPDAYLAFGLDLLLAGIKVMALPERLAVLSRGSMVAVPGVAASPTRAVEVAVGGLRAIPCAGAHRVLA
jgi:hypothetical protein